MDQAARQRWMGILASAAPPALAELTEPILDAAILDALLQTQAYDEIERTILAPLCDAAQMRRTVRSQKAEATRVNFFTMFRGEDA